MDWENYKILENKLDQMLTYVFVIIKLPYTAELLH